MARQNTKPDEPSDGSGGHQLRTKYAELTRKYAGVVATLERRINDRVVSRFGWLGLQATGTAFALLRGQSVVLANRRWGQLSIGDGPWRRRSTSNGTKSYANLNTLAIAEAKAAITAESGMVIEVFDRPATDTSLELRFEVAASGETPTVMALATDVTERLRREQELMRTREALLQKEHLRVIGELTASVSHEMGSTLRGMAARLTVLSTDAHTVRHHRAVLHGLMESIHESQRALRRLLAAARAGSLTAGPVRLDEVVNQAITVLQLDGDGEEKPEVRVDLPVPPVMGTPAELSHLFITLLRNGRDAMPSGGQISIRGSSANGYVVIRVADRGSGIPPRVMRRLFEPFFTTKGDQGTGLGLWLAASTMRRLGGAISAANRPGGGAVFTLRFRPATSIDGVRSALQVPDPTPLPRSGRPRKARA
jgi:signal transduction histidine kinase